MHKRALEGSRCHLKTERMFRISWVNQLGPRNWSFLKIQVDLAEIEAYKGSKKGIDKKGSGKDNLDQPVGTPEAWVLSFINILIDLGEIEVQEDSREHS